MNDLKLQEFLTAIDGKDSGWQECSVQIAADILAEFSNENWQHLAQQVLSRPAYWQERCAEAVGMSEKESGIPILLSLINSDSMQVSAIAASELDNLDVCIPAENKARLEDLLAYLNSQQSPRNEDVRRLLSQCGKKSK